MNVLLKFHPTKQGFVFDWERNRVINLGYREVHIPAKKKRRKKHTLPGSHGRVRGL